MNSRTPQRILLIRLSSIGDIVLTTPLVRLLRKRFPDCEIDYLTKSRFKELICHHPELSRVLEFPDHGRSADLAHMRKMIRDRRYDLILDLHKNLRSLFLTALQNNGTIRRLKKYGFRRFLLVKTGINLYGHIVPVYKRYLDVAGQLGIENDQLGTELYLPDETVVNVREQILHEGSEQQKIIALAPGAGFATKRWPVERFRALAGQILAHGYRCCVVGDQNDRELARQICDGNPGCIDLTGKLSLLETAAVLALSEKVVCNDSGVMHIAEAVGTPVVAMFGSTVRELGFFPLRPQSRVIENRDIRCRPCSHVGRHHCPRGHFDCMRTLATERIASALFEAGKR